MNTMQIYRIFAEVYDEDTMSDEPCGFEPRYFSDRDQALAVAQSECEVLASEEEREQASHCGESGAASLIGFYHDEGGIRFAIFLDRPIKVEKSSRDLSEVFQSLTIRVEIPHEAADYHVYLPKDPVAWKEKIQKGIRDVGQITMVIDTVAHGCDGLSIAFLPEYGTRNSHVAIQQGEGFGFVVNRKTLAQMIRALQMAQEEYK